MGKIVANLGVEGKIYHKSQQSLRPLVRQNSNNKGFLILIAAGLLAVHNVIKVTSNSISFCKCCKDELNRDCRVMLWAYSAAGQSWPAKYITFACSASLASLMARAGRRMDAVKGTVPAAARDRLHEVRRHCPWLTRQEPSCKENVAEEH